MIQRQEKRPSEPRKAGVEEETSSSSLLRSTRNPLISEIRRQLGHGSSRGQDFFAIEGPRLLSEAIRAGIGIETFLATPSWDEDPGHAPLLRSLRAAAKTSRRVDARVMRALSDTEQPQGLLALARRPGLPALAPVLASAPLLLVLVDLQDPGNCGTLARSHLAFGGSLLITVGSTADLWAPKALRASAGAVFHLACLHFPSFADLRRHPLLQPIPLLAAVPQGGRPPVALPLDRPQALLIGNEGRGLSPAILGSCAEKVSLPMSVPSESLNAAVAGSLLLYELTRTCRPSSDSAAS